MKTDSILSPSERITGLLFGRNRPARALTCPSPTQLLTPIVVSLILLSASATRGEETANRVSIIRVPGGGKVLKSERGADGTIHLLVDAPDGPRYLRSKDDGGTFSAPIAISDPAAQKPRLKFSGSALAVPPARPLQLALR